MKNRQEQAETGVYYAPEDLVGLGGRMLILGIDALVILLILSITIYLGEHLAQSAEIHHLILYIIGWTYLAGFQAAGLSTLGYRLAKAELVDFDGKRPSLWQCTLRVLFLLAGAANLSDLVLMSFDTNRQTLRDKAAKTYVVRRGARPVGRAPIVYSVYFISNLTFTFPEVIPGEASEEQKEEKPVVCA